MKNIDITTTQNVTIEYELASLGERIFATAIDLTLISISFGLLTALLGPFLEWSSWGSVIIGGSFLIYYIGFYLIFEWFMNGQTPGKKALGLKIVKLNGSEATFNDYLTRAAFHTLDSLFSAGTLAALLVSSTAKHQRLGDIIAGTSVIKVRSNFHLRLDDIQKISTLADHEVTFPSVRQFSEKDMLLIKTVIARYQKYPNDSHRDVVKKTVSHMMEKLDIEKRPLNSIKFLKTLISDYIVLTR